MKDKSDFEALKVAALLARENSYSPYSHFAVGAAVESESGRVFSGCNVENASYGLTNCAERSAIFCAIAAGEHRLRRLAVAADSSLPVAPCGACRQVMHEFGIQEVMLCNTAGASKVLRMAELLPEAFGPEQLKGETDYGKKA